MTPVIFRAERSGPFKGDVTAVFPTNPGDHTLGSMTCYAHIGQHSVCTLDWYYTTRPAEPREYTSLLNELLGQGYDDLHVCSRVTPAMRRDLRLYRARTG